MPAQPKSRNQTPARPVLVLALLIGALTNAATCAVARAENEHDLTGRWGLGITGGAAKLVEGEWDYATVDPSYGGHLSKSLSAQWNLTFALHFGKSTPGVDTPLAEAGLSGKQSFPLETRLVTPSVLLQHRFSRDARLSPVVGFGLGLTNWRVRNEEDQTVAGFDNNGDEAELKGSDLAIIWELGLDLALNENLRFNLGARYDIWTGNEKDNIGLSSIWGPDYVDANTARISVQAGLTWWFGAGDRDRDGVPNQRDLCPDDAEDRDGYNDNDGCPDADNDGDGILDADDTCPNLAEDRDGFQDEDGCPDPDNDKDGIADGRDRCPNEAEDIDGWEDKDGCPDLDNDGDGIPDARDKCPRTPAGAIVDSAGCRIVEPAATPPAPTTPIPPAPATDAGVVLKGVNFVTGSAELTPESIAELISLAGILSREPDTRIEIQGHTDASGDAARNLELSRRRAQAVRASLIQMGIEAERLSAVGYGEERPLGDNATPAGRALNRRVEIHRR